MNDFRYITAHSDLVNESKELQKIPSLAIDIECENNLHHFGTYISLLQISSEKKNWIIDVLLLKQINPLIEIFEDQKIQKIFHDINFDLRIISHQFSCKVRNFFDTQLAAEFLGKQKISLGSLLKEYFNLEKEEKYQRIDWTRRPLSNKMLLYATQDSAHLLELKRRLELELQEKHRLSWVYEECKYLESLPWEFKEQSHLDISGVKSMTPQQRAVLHALFEARKVLAKEIDRPSFMIFSNKLLITFAKNPPISWKTLPGVHPLVRQRASFFSETVKKSSLENEENARTEHWHLTTEEYQKIKMILEKRNEIAEKLGIKGHLVLKEEQVREMVVTKSLQKLRPWQKELFAKEDINNIIPDLKNDFS